MNGNRFTAGFCLISCLALWGFAWSAAAATIVVTTNQDTVDPPFNTGGPCGTGTISNLPGADGKVSLREAIIAANNTPGAKTITFAPNLSGATIVVSDSLALCGGHTTLNGDVNGDDTPDITVDGSALTSDVIDVFSSHNTVKNLRVLAPNLPNLAPFSSPGVAGIAIVPSLAVATTVTDNTIAHNILTGSIIVAAGCDVLNNRTSINATTNKHALVRDNTVVGGPFGILAFNFGDQNVITDLTIAGNTVSGTTGLPGIIVTGGWQNPFDGHGAADNRVDVLIKDNTSTGNNVPGDIAGMDILGGLFLASHNRVTAQVLNNTVTNNIGAGMSATAAAEPGSSDNSLDIIMRNNTVTGNSLPGGPGGIEVLGGGISSSSNHVTADLIDNIITDNNGVGIDARAGLINGSSNRADVQVRGNTITGNSLPGGAAGISVVGGIIDSSGNQITANLLDNIITDNNGAGIVAGAGLDNSSDNDIEVKIRGNTLENNAGVGILTFGAIGAAFSPSGDSSGNSLDARIERNTVKNAFLFGIWVNGGIGSFDGASNKVANNNEVNAVVMDNTVTDTTGEGLHLEAGGPGEANDNDVEVTVRKNTVCSSTDADIHAIGGLLGNPFLIDNTGTGNALEGEISENTASTVVVEDGVAGNSADVTQSQNVLCP